MHYDIESVSNDRIKHLVRLRRRKTRDAESLFVVEEQRILDRALEAGHRPMEVFWAPDLCDRPWDGPVVTVTSAAMEKATYRSGAEGVLAVFSYLETDLGKIALSTSPLILVLESIEKPGNLGAVLRIADGAGLDGVFVVDPLVDPFNPNAVRASTGALFTTSFAIGSLEEATAWLASNGIRSVATTDRAATTLWQTDLTVPTAVWVGSESSGLSASALGSVHESVRIPMEGSIDSLNAAVSSAVVLYEAKRQRLQSGGAS